VPGAFIRFISYRGTLEFKNIWKYSCFAVYWCSAHAYRAQTILFITIYY
jgi:hypothetical protein